MARSQRVCSMLILLTVVYAVDVDYFEPLRTQALRNKWSSEIFDKVYCQIQCGTDSAITIGNKCFCATVYEADDIDLNGISPSEDDDSYDSEEKIDSVERPLDYTLLLPTSSLRHHIAHFCPNLEVARNCIRKCMKLSRAAFCGKDHVCYCGHTYTTHDDNNQTNKQDYKQFKDLYKKYFGENVKK